MTPALRREALQVVGRWFGGSPASAVLEPTDRKGFEFQGLLTYPDGGTLRFLFWHSSMTGNLLAMREDERVAE